ncbi:MAG: NAD(P)/FAD-dependent oxidoreductase [Acidimicrobiia bacterium]
MRRSVIIVGGGYAGVEVAKRLGRDADVTIISNENFLTFTPMLAEVAFGDIEPRHITAPLRQLCRDATVIVGDVVSVDTTHRSVEVRLAVSRRTERLTGDVLVLASGSESADFGISGVFEHAIPFKTIADALRIRRRVLSLLESAAHSGKAAESTVIVVGAGYSGAELASGMADFLGEVIPRYYPTAPPGRVALIDAVDRPVPMMSKRLGRAATKALRRRGVGLLLGQRVAEVNAGSVILEDGTKVEAATTVWAAGIKPGSATVGLEDGKRLSTDGSMAMGPGVYALGDAAAVPDGRGGVCAPTAQAAIAQGRWLGDHLLPLLDGAEVKPFRYKTKGQLVSLGHRNAVGTVFGIGVSRWPAWFMWRSYYLFRLPTVLRKIRVALDWTLDLVFPPDIAAIPSGDLGPDMGDLAES